MLGLEQFAEVRAAIERTADKDRVLREAGLSPRAWIQVQRHWLAALSDEVSHGSGGLAERYRRAYEASAAPAPAEPVAAVEPAAETGAPAAFVPSYMAQGRSMMSAAPAMMSVTPAMMSVTPATVSVTPATVSVTPAMMSVTPATVSVTPAMMSAAPAEAPPTQRAPGGLPVVVAPSPLQGTSLSLDIPRGPATPFRQAAPGAAPVAVRTEPVVAPRRTGTAPGKEMAWPAASPFSPPPASTVAATTAAPAVSPSSPLASTVIATTAAPAVSPFSPAPASAVAATTAPAAPSAAAPTAAASAPAPPSVAGPQLPRVNQAPASISGTALALDIPKIIAAMPFQKARAAGSGDGPPASSAALPAPDSVARPAAAASATPGPSTTPGPSAPHAPEALLPAASLPDLAAEQYAWLVAALRRARGPAEVEQAFRALGMSPDLQRPLEELWRARMAADPASQQRFLAALQRYLASPAK